MEEEDKTGPVVGVVIHGGKFLNDVEWPRLHAVRFETIHQSCRAATQNGFLEPKGRLQPECM